MNILILGQPRCGKTTIAKKLGTMGFNIIGLDEIRQAFKDCLPEIDIYKQGTETEINEKYENIYLTFVKSYIYNFNKKYPNVNNVIEGMEITLRKAKELFPNSLIIGLGVITDNKDKFIGEIRYYSRHTEHDWTKDLSILELEELVDRIINYSIENRKIAKELKIPFYSHTGIRDNAYDNKIIDYINEELNKLDSEFEYYY